MAMSTSNSKLTQLFLPTFITFFIILLNKVNSSSNQISFTINNFISNQTDLIFQGDASVSSTGALQLIKLQNNVPTQNSVGRVLYSKPIHIWDSKNSKVSSFTTSFSFIVNSPNINQPGDGLAFFLAPSDSQIPPNSIGNGGFLGIFNDQTLNPSNQIVAVEFDTYAEGNVWDPSFQHIGIDVNTIASIQTVSWGWRNGEVANVIINYVASNKTLTATLTYPSDQTSTVVTASVDLKKILPEFVRVGFSAATGALVETNNILKWSFSSTFKSKN
ncbi:hypothetical protein Lal_00032953 [Lupinus albus]|uniref:Putative concanavalin A-like lectin/glucanase domain, legume lectin n=1 Tax=Lupinus albus TaxID=3870 RepID=A0A6A4RBQ5_LUPAL|nr:putative concanavalin A-like lectin/glucanase domain, legume lectin [Lupinus albus]KAF1898188.1 hypothetical protein Lal_00032953 [Lupinus albus]